MKLLINLASVDLPFTFITSLVSDFCVDGLVETVPVSSKDSYLRPSYTTSIITLVAISYQRVKAVTSPFNALMASWPYRQYIHWCTFTACRHNSVVCLAKTGNIGTKIYYSLHTTVFFAAPLLYIIFKQSLIFRSLRSRVVSMRPTSFISKSHQRHRKAAKTLAALTIAFVICWSPFMITRTLMYFRSVLPDFGWKVSQLLIFLNAGLDPLLYGYILRGKSELFFCEEGFFAVVVKKARNHRRAVTELIETYSG